MTPVRNPEVADTQEVDRFFALPQPTVYSVLESRSPGDTVAENTALLSPRWYALWTRSHCERLVWDQLTSRGFHAFLPTVDVWSQRAGVRHRIQVPLFPGYLFLHHAMDKAGFIEVQKTRGIVRILGERWDCLTVIPDSEVKAVQIVSQAGVPILPYAYLRDGQRVRIARGPLAHVEGILVRQNPRRGLLVLSVDLLQQSIAVEVDCTCVVPA